jgi:DNA-binding GntR family transcriptional regulator
LLQFVTDEWLDRHSAAVPSKDAALIFEALDMALTHVVHRLADPSASLGTDRCERVERHIEAQATADGDAGASQRLAADFLRLLAGLYGNKVLTGLVDEMLRLQPLHPRPRAGLQRRLLDAIEGRRPDDAVEILASLSR